MTAYYLSPSGSDSANGLSTATPWLTRGHANSNTVAGDTIYHLSGGTWNDQYYNIAHEIHLDVYNGSDRAIFDADGFNPGTNHADISLSGANSTVNLIDVSNNRSGNDHTDGGRGIEYAASGIQITNCRIHNTHAVGMIRNFSGDDILIQDTILEQIAQGYSGGIWSGGSTAAGDSNPVDNYTVRRVQVFEVYGEALSAYTFNATNRCTGILMEDNDVFAGAAAGIYLNGVNGATVRRNTIIGTSNTDYHRFTGYCGYGLGLDNESASNTTNNDTKWYLNLVAYQQPGFLIGRGVGTAITNLHIAHNTWVDCKQTVGCGATGAGDFTGAGNIFRQNASILISGTASHDNGTDVPSSGVWDLDENFWDGGGEHANLNHASDFSDSAWMPFKTTGWQSVAAFDDITVEDFRPTTRVTGTQFTNPDTSSNWADFESSANFIEAGALAFSSGTPEEPIVTTGALLFPPGYAPTDGGAVVPGGKLRFYRTGTTTDQNTYSDSTLSTPNANPVVLNSEGYLDTLIYGDPNTGYNYRVRLLNSSDVEIWTEDDVLVDGADTATLVTGSFTGTLTGYASGPTGTVNYKVTSDSSGVGKIVVLSLSAGISGTSNATSMTMTGLPVAVSPSTAVFIPTYIIDAGANAAGAAQIAASGTTITFYKGTAPPSASGFTGSSTKGLDSGWQLVYAL